MQARGATLAPGILFDSDMGQSLDTAIALSMLHGLGRGRVIAVGVSNSSLDAAAFCDIIGRYYGNGGGLPIGVADSGPKLEASAMLQAVLGKRNPEGQPTFRSNIRSVLDTGDPPVIFRNALLTQQDMQAIVVAAGPATNLAHTLGLSGARNIIASKVRTLVLACGNFGSRAVDPRIRADIASARKIFSEWPSPIVLIGVEAANAIPYPEQSIETDFVATMHPVGAAYQAYRETQASAAPAAGIPTQAVLAALYAANASADYFKLSAAGSVEITDDGHTTFRESSKGNHRYLIVEPAQKEAITQAFVAMASVKPTARSTPSRN